MKNSEYKQEKQYRQTYLDTAAGPMSFQVIYLIIKKDQKDRFIVRYFYNGKHCLWGETGVIRGKPHLGLIQTDLSYPCITIRITGVTPGLSVVLLN